MQKSINIIKKLEKLKTIQGKLKKLQTELRMMRKAETSN